MDPHPELLKHPMSLEALQSSSKITLCKFPNLSQGVPPRQSFLCLAEWIFVKIARLRGSSNAFRAQDSDPMVCECVESVFGVSKNRKFKNAQNEIMDVIF